MSAEFFIDGKKVGTADIKFETLFAYKPGSLEFSIREWSLAEDLDRMQRGLVGEVEIIECWGCEDRRPCLWAIKSDPEPFGGWWCIDCLADQELADE